MSGRRKNLAALIIVALTVLFIYTGCGGGGSSEVTFSAGDALFTMIAVKGNTFPVGVDDSGEATVENDFLIAETEVTYQLWSAVHTWAVANGYTFANPGRQGGSSDDGPYGNSNHPVTEINWRDCMVWCNALTEYYNDKKGTSLACVYKNADTPIRSSEDTHGAVCDAVVPDDSADGFRLVTSNEHELAARYLGKESPDTGNDIDTEVVTTEVSGVTWYWTPGDYASGAEANGLDDEATGEVAWYFKNSDSVTHEVGAKKSNTLGLYDMSGNVNEWRFDFHPTRTGERVARGGGLGAGVSGDGQSGFLIIGHIPAYEENFSLYTLGFRLGKNK